MTELLGHTIYFLLNRIFLWERFAVSSSENPFEIHPYLVGRLKKDIRVGRGSRTITTTAFHTRWTGRAFENRKAKRIAVMGGSTTFGTRVSDLDSWPALLQSELGSGYAVFNYGVPGYSTAENIIQLALDIPENAPHIVVFYGGWNDIRNYHVSDLGADYFAHGMNQYGNLGLQIKASDTHEPLYDTLVRISAMFALASKLNQLWSNSYRQKLVTQTTFDTPDPFVDKIYLRNLKTLKRLAQNCGAKIVFVPQVLNYAFFKGRADSSPWSPYIKNSAMPALLDRFNSIMDLVCAPNEQSCSVLSEVLGESWQSSDFVDEGHFNRTGGDKFSKILVRHIKALN